MKRRTWLVLGLLLILLGVGAGLNGCRRVTLVGDSLFGCARDAIVSAINNNAGNSWVYKEHIWGGCTAYNNPINSEIYGKGIEEAFSYPDVVAFSLGSNDMLAVAGGKISMESALQAMQTLINQAVASGANCIVLLESTHRMRVDFQCCADSAFRQQPIRAANTQGRDLRRNTPSRSDLQQQFYCTLWTWHSSSYYPNLVRSAPWGPKAEPPCWHKAAMASAKLPTSAINPSRHCSTS